MYQDAVAQELEYVLQDAGIRFAIAEDQEQVDKLIECRERSPGLEHILYDDPRGLRHYSQAFLRSIDAVQELGRSRSARQPDFIDSEIGQGKAGDVAIMLYTSGTTGKPKGVCITHSALINAARGGCGFDRLSADDEILSYLPMAWVGDNLFSYAQSLLAGFTVNCPESGETVMTDMREIGPTYYFAPPRVFENLLTQVMIRIEDAGAIKRGMFHYFMGVARRCGAEILDGRRVAAGERLLYALGNVLVYGPLRNVLGMSRVRVAYTAGAAIGPDLFRFYRSIGINLKQLYGSTETCAYVCLQKDGQIKLDTVGIPAPGVEVKIADSGEVLVKSGAMFKEYYKRPDATAETIDAEGYFHTGDAGFFDADGQLKIIDRAKDVGKMANGALYAPNYIENKLKFFPHIKEAVAFGARPPDGVRLHQHRHRRGRQLGRAAQYPLLRLHRPGAEARGVRAGARMRGESQRRARARSRAVRFAGAPLPHPAQGARSGRRRAHAHAQGAPRFHRGEIRRADRRALFGQDLAVHRDAGQVRGRAQRQGQRRPAHRGSEDLSAGDGEEGCVMGAGLNAGRKIGDVVLGLEGISLAFGGVNALQEVSFDVREHEIRAIIGPNGAGKSSMLNVINGVYHPQQGTVTFNGVARHDVNTHEAAVQGIARTFQNIALFKGMSVLDNIMTGRNLRMKSGLLAQAFRLPSAEREEMQHREAVEQIIDFLEIQAYRRIPVGRLPYGLQKRVDLARALAMEPKLLLLDEPMAGMNVEEKQDMCRFILDVNDEFGTTIVLIEHDMGVVMDISDRVVVLDYGKKIGDGTPDEVRGNQAVIDAYLGVSH